MRTHVVCIKQFHKHLKVFLSFIIISSSVFSHVVSADSDHVDASDFEYIASTSIKDTNGNLSPEVAVLRVHPDGRVLVYIQDSLTQEIIRRISFVRQHNPIDLTVISDLNGNGSDELMVLSQNKVNQQVIVQIKDSLTAAFIRRLDAPSGIPEKEHIKITNSGTAFPGEESTITLQYINATSLALPVDFDSPNLLPDNQAFEVIRVNPPKAIIPAGETKNFELTVFNKTDMRIVFDNFPTETFAIKDEQELLNLNERADNKLNGLIRELNDESYVINAGIIVAVIVIYILTETLDAPEPPYNP